MQMDDRILYFDSLDGVARRLLLPKSYLQQLVAEKKLPYLDVRGRKRYNPVDVKKALDKITIKGGDDIAE